LPNLQWNGGDGALNLGNWDRQKRGGNSQEAFEKGRKGGGFLPPPKRKSYSRNRKTLLSVKKKRGQRKISTKKEKRTKEKTEVTHEVRKTGHGVLLKKAHKQKKNKR